MRYPYHRHHKLRLTKSSLYPPVNHSCVVCISFSLRTRLFFNRKSVHTLNFISLRQELDALMCLDNDKEVGKLNPEINEATGQAFEESIELTKDSLFLSKGSC